jgi:PhnB protein
VALDYAGISPYLICADAEAEIDFLGRAFGFRELLRATNTEGELMHAELRLGERSVMLGGGGRSPDESSPRMLIHMYVDDVDALYRRAVEAGAKPMNEPEDKPEGDRRGDVLDPEGFWWSLSQHVRDVPPSEWGGTIA